MAKHISDPAMNGFRLEDLMSEDGVTFEIGNEFYEDDDEEFSYSPSVQFSNEEMLDMLNMNDFEDEDSMDDEKGSVSLYGMSFEKLKTKMTSIAENQKVMKFVKQKGVGELIPDNAQITIHYIGYFEDRDEPFDSTYSSGRPRTLRLGQGCIIPGLEIGICTMQKHEIAVFLIHPDLAYKNLGCPPRIPPNEEVTFVVHLVDYLDDGSADTYYTLKAEERQLIAHVELPISHMFVAAKDYCKKFNTKRAIREYRKIIDCLENLQLRDSFEEKKMNEFLSKANTNLGICYNQIKQSRNACLACRRVPIPTAKTHYHFGKALLNMGEYTNAMKELQKAYTLEPYNEDIRQLIQLINTKQRQYLEIEKRLWQNCFKSDKKTKINELRNLVHELCKTIDGDNVTRRSIPEGLREEELQIIREEVASLGLNIMTYSRYGKEIMYIQKSKA